MPSLDETPTLQSMHIHAVKDHRQTTGLPVAKRSEMDATHGNAADNQIALGNERIALDTKVLESLVEILNTALESGDRVLPARVCRVIDPIGCKEGVECLQVGATEGLIKGDDDRLVQIGNVFHEIPRGHALRGNQNQHASPSGKSTLEHGVLVGRIIGNALDDIPVLDDLAVLDPEDIDHCLACVGLTVG